MSKQKHKMDVINFVTDKLHAELDQFVADNWDRDVRLAAQFEIIACLHKQVRNANGHLKHARTINESLTRIVN
jgi:hypothetical protein